MRDAIRHYREIFKLDQSVELVEPALWEAGEETSYYFGDGRIFFRNDPEEREMLPYLFGEIKMGLAGHPLLSWMRFQPEYTDEDFESINLFATLITPLREAWIYRIMKYYMPEDEFSREIENFRMEADLLKERIDTGGTDGDVTRLILSRTTYELVMYSLSMIDDISPLALDSMVAEEKGIMEMYRLGLKTYAMEDPSVELYMNLVDRLNLNISINLVWEPYPHFELKARGDA